MNKEQIKRLIAKYLAGDCSEEESILVESWYSHYQEDPGLKINQRMVLQSTDRIHSRLKSLLEPKSKRLFRKLSIAASILLVVAITGYLNSNQLAVDQIVYQHDVTPGVSGATLTLANGKKIKLSDAASGELAQQAGVLITKSEDGQLVYEIKDSNTDVDKINTLSTARGETYRLRLPDGSLVYLNAASSLTYSANLIKQGKRVVTLSGEAYFEVSKDLKHPFIVASKGQQVEVLGTHFNINAYDNEREIKTTLLQGRVKVSTGSQTALIKPGQQVLLQGSTLTTADADTTQAVSWKNGFFNFHKSDIQTVMRQLSRWYNVEVEYEGAIPRHQITGKVHRDSELSAALQVLKYLDINYTVKGRMITIKP